MIITPLDILVGCFILVLGPFFCFLLLAYLDRAFSVNELRYDAKTLRPCALCQRGKVETKILHFSFMFWVLSSPMLIILGASFFELLTSTYFRTTTLYVMAISCILSVKGLIGLRIHVFHRPLTLCANCLNKAICL
mgnify:FL=1